MVTSARVGGRARTYLGDFGVGEHDERPFTLRLSVLRQGILIRDELLPVGGFKGVGSAFGDF